MVADLFDWHPDEGFDGVVSCFWLSHVPRSRFGSFAAKVVDVLEPGGRLFFLDAKREPTSTAVDHALPGREGEVMTRRLNDGTTYRIVKNFWSSRALRRTFSIAGVDVDVRETSTFFQYGTGVRSRSPRGTTHAAGFRIGRTGSSA